MNKKKKGVKEKSHFQLLKDEWLKRHRRARHQLHRKHKETFEAVVDKFPAKDKLAHGAIGALMLSSVLPSSPAIISTIADKPQEPAQEIEVDRTNELVGELKTVAGDNVRELSIEEEAKVGEILSRYFKAQISAEIDGKRLNRSYGVIGAEQHLVRFPSDSMASHLEVQVENNKQSFSVNKQSFSVNKMIYSSGMAPGRGAWGYFAKSKAEFTLEDLEREKWYIAVQTFAAPNYNQKLSEYRDFFKYRKMLVVNVKTGQAIVCDIADAGPAQWTGKHLGGSPEVMYYLGFGEGSRKGGVLYFFVDDIDNKIPLGPVVAR